MMVFTNPQLPSGLMDPAVGVGTATGIDVDDTSGGVHDGMIIVQLPLWHLFTPQNSSPVPHLPAALQQEPHLPPHLRFLFCDLDG